MHGALFAATALAALAAPTFGAGRPTYSVDYVVRLSRREPGLAHVHWLLAGIDEIAAFRLVFRDDRTTDVRGTGRLVWHGRTWLIDHGAALFRQHGIERHQRDLHVGGVRFTSCQLLAPEARRQKDLRDSGAAKSPRHGHLFDSWRPTLRGCARGVEWDHDG